MDGKPILLCILLSLISIQAEVTPTSPRVERDVGITPGESFAETTRNYVHVVDNSRGALFTLDTATGEFLAATKLRGVPNSAALMCASRDNTKLFVPLSSARAIQVISFADLSTIDILHVPLAPQCLAMAAG